MKSSTISRGGLSLGLATVAAVIALIGSMTTGQASASAKVVIYPRAETLITIGTQWGTIQGFNPYQGDYAVGTVGLCNETLLRYDPLTDKYINWLAKSAKFAGAKVYVVVIRPSIKWSDGLPFTAKDVAWNFNLGRFKTASWHDLWMGLKAIKVSGDRVSFLFKAKPHYAEWQHLIWNLPMISPAQGAAITDAAAFQSYNPSDPVGTGPYTLDVAGYEPTTRVVWKKKADWWAANQGVAPSPKPTYIIDLVNTSNLDWFGGGFLSGIMDLDNDYLPGVQNLVKSGHAQTYYPGAPYHLSANTSWLTPNTQHKPLNDPVFRRALATSINVGEIVENDYGNLVLPASPNGLLPIWKKWINNKLVKKYGFKYNTAKAVKLLKKAGYEIGPDGYFRNKDGSELTLSIAVPQGWSDWESARDMIIASAKKAHIHIQAVVGDYDIYESARNRGSFDLVIDYTAQMSDNPWTYFDFLFHQPVIQTGSGQTFANYSRFGSAPKDKKAAAKAWRLVKQLDATPLGKIKARKAIMSQLEQITMTSVPNIPLWYNGLWSQWQSKYWTNWPSAAAGKGHYVPSMWRGYMQMTGIDMITHLQPSS